MVQVHLVSFNLAFIFTIKKVKYFKNSDTLFPLIYFTHQGVSKGEISAYPSSIHFFMIILFRSKNPTNLVKWVNALVLEISKGSSLLIRNKIKIDTKFTIVPIINVNQLIFSLKHIYYNKYLL